MKQTQRGFSLIEIALGVVIIGLMFGGALMSMSSQRENQSRRETEEQIKTIKEAIIGFAMAKGYVPCPATAASNGVESPVGGGNCTALVGEIPYQTLGISGSLNNGLLIDGWNNPLAYSVTQSNAGGAGSADFTTAGDMRTVQIQNLTPDLQVCQQANCPASTLITTSAPVVIVSMGKNGTLNQGTDELENTDGTDTQFVSRGIADVNGPGHFDDVVDWISPQLLYSRMVTAGQLP